MADPPLDSAFVRASYEADGPVAHYARAADTVGLWRSERRLIDRLFRLNDRILDLGCGAGRTTLALARLGYRHIEGIDQSGRLIKAAWARAGALPVSFSVADARELPYPDRCFDAAFFSFNGLMTIPGRLERIRAMAEVARVLRPGGVFLFTTHDRDENEQFRGFWKAEARRWRKGKRDSRIPEFGGILFDHDGAPSFIHVPDRAEVLDSIAQAGLEWTEDHWRGDLAQEPPQVEEFALPCRFWVARRALAEDREERPSVGHHRPGD
ncbi:MAG: class I SAM-dependent methyltransferase [Dehalococcoidia bacterium]